MASTAERNRRLQYLTPIIGEAKARWLVRYEHRISRWFVGEPTVKADEIEAEIADIRKVEVETARSRQIVERERAPLMDDRGNRTLGIEWDQSKEIKP